MCSTGKGCLVKTSEFVLLEMIFLYLLLICLLHIYLLFVIICYLYKNVSF